MLRFLSSLFAPTPEKSNALDDALIDKAIERVVLGTDRRLNALGQCRKRLREPVEVAVSHVISLVDALPPPVEISPRAFSGDPVLRAFFVSAEHLSETLGGFNTVRDLLEESSEFIPDEIFGLLTMAREERSVFGMELEGDNLRRDVIQVAVNFSRHRYLGPTGSEEGTRLELKKRAFDFLIQRALERITNERVKRQDLDRQRHLLNQKLEAMKSGRWGLGAMLNGGERHHPDLARLEAEIDAIEAELGEFHTDRLGLEESLEYVAETLIRPEDWLAACETRLRVDYRGIKVADSSPVKGEEILLTELFSGTGERRTVLFGKILRGDIPDPPNYLERTKHYL